jgi:hypothetical protein
MYVLFFLLILYVIYFYSKHKILPRRSILLGHPVVAALFLEFFVWDPPPPWTFGVVEVGMQVF